MGVLAAVSAVCLVKLKEVFLGCPHSCPGSNKGRLRGYHFMSHQQSQRCLNLNFASQLQLSHTSTTAFVVNKVPVKRASLKRLQVSRGHIWMKTPEQLANSHRLGFHIVKMCPGVNIDHTDNMHVVSWSLNGLETNTTSAVMQTQTWQSWETVIYKWFANLRNQKDHRKHIKCLNVPFWKKYFEF